jgi:hypothetical protein
VKPELAKSFRAPLEATGTSLRWVIVRVPIDLKKAWPMWKSRRVFGEINGFAFKTALIPAAKGQGQVLIVNKKMLSGAHVRAGERPLIKLSPDLGEVVIDLPPEFAKILKANRDLRKFFDAMSPSMRKGFTNFIADAKSAETRVKRSEAIPAPARGPSRLGPHDVNPAPQPSSRHLLRPNRRRPRTPRRQSH